MDNDLGFSLIELLVVVAILLLLISVGFANFIRFSDRQKAAQLATQLRLAMEEGRAFAQAQTVPAGCFNELLAYRVRVGESCGSAVCIYAVCGGDELLVKQTSLNLTNLSLIPASFFVEFSLLHNGASGYVDNLIRVGGSSSMNSFQVFASGQIQPVVVEYK